MGGGSHLISLGLTWSHVDSLGLTWSHLDSMDLTWTHLDTLDLTCVHLDSLDLTWTHLISLGLTWSHLGSLDLTWILLISSIAREGEHLISQEKMEGIPPRQKGKRSDFWDPSWPYMQLRAHARTKRNDFPVGLSPPTSDIYIYICIFANLLTSLWCIHTVLRTYVPTYIYI